LVFFLQKKNKKSPKKIGPQFSWGDQKKKGNQPEGGGGGIEKPGNKGHAETKQKGNRKGIAVNAFSFFSLLRTKL